MTLTTDALDNIETSARNRILMRPDDPGCAPDALTLVHEVHRLRTALTSAESEITKLRHESDRHRKAPPVYGLCELCPNVAELGSRWCHFHLKEVETREYRRHSHATHRGTAHLPTRADREDVRRRGRVRAPGGDGGPGWEDAVKVMEA